jgi:hypothetical protein
MRIEAKTRMAPKKVIDLARRYFGGDLGMTEARSDPSMAVFVGGGGGTAVGAQQDDGTTTVEVLSREWDHQARQFMAKLHPVKP